MNPMLSVPRDAEALDAYSQVVTAVAAHLLPSVASLRPTGRRGRGGPAWPGRGPRGPGLPGPEPGGGSAVALTGDGYLLTSAHVVAGTERGLAAFDSGEETTFEVIGRDPLSDLAVVRADARDLPAAELGDADRLRVGQLVVAVGSPLGYAGSVSAGVVSGLGRSLVAQASGQARLVENVIQTDAALHPGNSGGALADSTGRVVGVNTAVVGPGIGQGLGLAVPVDAATRAIVGTLLSGGRVRRAYLGLAGDTRPLPPRAAEATGRRRGIEILSVVEGSPAARAGLRPEDLVVAVDGVAVENMGALQRLMTADRVGAPVALQIVRGGAVQQVRIVPAELPTG